VNTVYVPETLTHVYVPLLTVFGPFSCSSP